MMKVKLTKQTTCEITQGFNDDEMTFKKNQVFVIDPDDDFDDDFYMAVDHKHEGELMNVVIPKANCIAA